MHRARCSPGVTWHNAHPVQCAVEYRHGAERATAFQKCYENPKQAKNSQAKADEANVCEQQEGEGWERHMRRAWPGEEGVSAKPCSGGQLTPEAGQQGCVDGAHHCVK